MIHTGTDQRFTANEAATEALRGRVANIDQYNIKGTTNVYFDTAKYNLSQQARYELCQAAAQAKNTDNALLLVVGYTDSTGDYEYNQELSEKRASRVVNFLQQECDWAPYRMLTPTGMAEADPGASASSPRRYSRSRFIAENSHAAHAASDPSGRAALRSASTSSAGRCPGSGLTSQAISTPSGAAMSCRSRSSWISIAANPRASAGSALRLTAIAGSAVMSPATR